MTDGEVAVRENGSVTAIEAETLDGNISVDLDTDPPSVGVQAETAIVYEDDTLEPDADPDSDDDVAADGGYVRNRVTTRQYGVGLRGGNRKLAVSVMAFTYAAAGYLLAIQQSTAALVTFAAAALVTYLLLFRRANRG